MTEFKIGDRVEISPSPRYRAGGGMTYPLPSIEGGGTGVIVRDPDSYGDYQVAVDGVDTRWISPEYLTLITEPYTFDPGGEKIEFSDVRVGDTIAGFQYGFWRVGEVATGRIRYVATFEGATLVNSDADDIRLLHRPEPEVDQAQVEALRGAMDGIAYAAFIDARDNHDLAPLAEALVKAGVKVDA